MEFAEAACIDGRSYSTIIWRFMLLHVTPSLAPLAMDAVGFVCGLPDLTKTHDQYLTEAFSA